MPEDRQYQSLYRKYRPQGPDEVLGQDHVIRALTGAIREGRLAHAFLFCGPRGTGKTSTARILAKMVNCERGPTAEPCGTCDQCVRIREGQHLDVVEIDAASHGGVDDARDLREKAPTAPVQGREKVYIIDEAQRLSREAFDALLKVFEEPPPGVRFVLATTEPHKMPATIVGRCQRFDFRRVPVEEVAAHLVRVAEREGMTVAPDAALAYLGLPPIAHAGALVTPGQAPGQPPVNTQTGSRSMNAEEDRAAISVPSYVRSNAARGLRYYEDGQGGDGLVAATISDARDMASGTVTEAKLRKMGPWISRHLVDLQAPRNRDANHPDYPGPGLVAMLLWGAGPDEQGARRTLSWVERKVAFIDAKSGS